MYDIIIQISYVFSSLKTSAIIDDSTSVGMVTLTGSGVQSMLQLSHDQWKCLEEEVSQTGEVFVQQVFAYKQS